ncbi:MAG: efflux RND transporter periplasmic adaptor subunit [Gammaproteobacteria bacterium]|nr:efflux RND transporter periplasmic adaptor subunit [Gammaproteobacteria bacterium]
MTDTLFYKLLLSFTLLISASVSVNAENKDTAISVQIKPIQQLLIQQSHIAPAKVVTNQQAKIHSQISAMIINKVPLQYLHINKGDVLIELDCRQPQINVQQQLSQIKLNHEKLSFSRKQLVRANKLKKDKNISQELIDQSKTNVKQLEINLKIQQSLLEQAKLNVEYCQIRSPFDGFISQRYVSIGSYANPMSPLLEITSSQNFEIEVTFNEQQKIPETADFKIGKYKDKATLVRRSALIDSQSKTLAARYQLFSGNTKNLSIGQTGFLNWQSQAQWLPPQYLVKRNNQYGIFLLDKQNDKNSAQFYALKDALPGQNIKVESNLNKTLIINGYQQLEDKAEVKISQ